MRVALFTSCTADLAAPGPALAAVRVLEAMGMTVDVPDAQTCCGQVALNSGHPGPATRLMRRWVRVFEDCEAVVGVSGSCTATVHHQFPRVLSGGPRRRAEEAVRRTWEFTQFVARYGAALDLALPGDVTWHDSCHMLRSLVPRPERFTGSRRPAQHLAALSESPPPPCDASPGPQRARGDPMHRTPRASRQTLPVTALGEKASPRDVLGRVRGLRVHEAAGSEVCCGFGGTFALKYPELSCAMADRKLDDVTGTGATHVVSSDSTCLLHLAGRAERRGVPVRTLHVAELLAAALPGGPRTLEEASA